MANWRWPWWPPTGRPPAVGAMVTSGSVSPAVARRCPMPCAFRARSPPTNPSMAGCQMIAGLVTLDALNGMIEEYGAAPNQPDCSLELKWPNDVFCHGLKLGGLLSELVIPPSSGTGTDADADDDVVIVFGVGLNRPWAPVGCPRRSRLRCSCMSRACRRLARCAMRWPNVRSRASASGW